MKRKLLIYISTIVGMTAGSHAQARAQSSHGCMYVTMGEAGVRVPISSDFPVLFSTDNRKADTAAFNAAVATWNQQHEGAAQLRGMPLSTSSYYITIPKSEFERFSAERKAAIQKMGSLFTIIN